MKKMMTLLFRRTEAQNLHQTVVALVRNLQARRLRLRVLATGDDVLTVALLFIAAVLPFVHLKFGTRIVDPFIMVSEPMRVDSFVWMLGGGFAWVCFSLFTYRTVQPKWRGYALLWCLYCVYDLMLFIWCYNRSNYYYLPYAIMIIIALKLIKK
jgi:hypothetical protein